MKILILGGGGREHALAAAMAQSPLCDTLICAPGNAGVESFARTEALAIEDPASVVGFCRDEGVGFVVIGPEAPLGAGVADALTAAGVACFGPNQAAARLETSKTFAKEICDACKAPTAAWASFDRPDAAKIYVMASGAPIVVKADGLAAGKGVVVAQTMGQALAAVDAVFAGGGERVLIEEMMSGEEASFFVLTDGEAVLPLPTAQDYKRAEDGDQGPNTGGMGAYSPATVLTAEIERKVIETIVRPVLAEMRKRGARYRGVLYVGLMIGEDGTPRVVEFNARFGDPEAQAILRRLNGDLAPALLACSEPVGVAARRRQRLDDCAPAWSEEKAIAVVVAARGYPGTVQNGEPIGNVSAASSVDGVEIFIAGAKRVGGRLLSNGGRVLAVTALAPSFAEAQKRAYAGARAIDWPGGFRRSDIGDRAVAAESAAQHAAEAAAQQEQAERDRAARDAQARLEAKEQERVKNERDAAAQNTGTDAEMDGPADAVADAEILEETPATPRSG